MLISLGKAPPKIWIPINVNHVIFISLLALAASTSTRMQMRLHHTWKLLHGCKSELPEHRGELKAQCSRHLWAMSCACSRISCLTRTMFDVGASANNGKCHWLSKNAKGFNFKIILYIYSYGNMTWHYMTWRYLKHSVQTKSVWMSNSDEVQQSNPRAQRTTEIAILNPEEKAAKSQSNPFLAEQAVEGQQKNWSQCRMVSFDWFLLIFNPPSSLHYKHLQTLQHLGPNTSRRSFLESDL